MLNHTNSLFMKFQIWKRTQIFHVRLYVQSSSIRIIFYLSELEHKNSNLASASYRLTSTHHSVTFSGLKIWNSFPSSMQNINSLPLFKLKLNQYFISKNNSLSNFCCLGIFSFVLFCYNCNHFYSYNHYSLLSICVTCVCMYIYIYICMCTTSERIVVKAFTITIL